MRHALRVAALLLAPALAWAGVQHGSIQGSVSDSAGRPLAGVLVTMTAGPSTLDRMVFTDSRGGFLFESLLPGEYAVQASLPRFATQKREKVQISGGIVAVRFNLLTVAEVSRRAASKDARQPQDIVWTLRSSRGTQSVLRYSDADATPLFGKLAPESGYLQFYSKTDPSSRSQNPAMGSRFSITLALPADGRVTFTGQYNESPLEPKGVGALYEFSPTEGHQARIAVNARQGLVLDDAFSAEELKELQVRYDDRFHVKNNIVVEQGLEVGHAEGRASNNYVRPRVAVSWIPGDTTVLTAIVNTQAPGGDDDPVRGREYFEQVNLPPSHEHYRHSEIGISQFLDEATKASVAVFEDRSNYRALFVRDEDGRQGLLVFDGKATPSRGLRLNLNREFHGFEAGLGYTVARGAAIAPQTARFDEVRGGIFSRPFHVVTARIKTDFELTNTELTAVYRWISRDAAGPIDPYQQALEYNDPSLSISVAQNLPTFGAIPARVQAIFDARNLLDQTVGNSKMQLAHSPRFVKGGINIRF